MMKKMSKMQKHRGTYAQFFLSVGLFFLGGGRGEGAGGEGLTRGS